MNALGRLSAALLALVASAFVLIAGVPLALLFAVLIALILAIVLVCCALVGALVVLGGLLGAITKTRPTKPPARMAKRDAGPTSSSPTAPAERSGADAVARVSRIDRRDTPT